MANNTIHVEFTTCEPAPINGYKITYRPVGSTDPYRDWPVNFMESPAVFTDDNDPAETSYEGFIQGDCGDGKLGVLVPWVANPGGSASGSQSASESPSVPEPGLCFNMKRGIPSSQDGAWSGNSSVLNGCSTLTISKRDRFGNDITAAVQAIAPGDIVTFVLESNPAIRARYVIDTVFFELANDITYTVTNLDGATYATTMNESFTMCLDYGESGSDSGG